MAERKYYWLKFQRDFFKRHDIRIIEKMKPNGKEYVLFYLKLMAESIDHEGTLRFSDELPYDNEMLSAVTETDLDIVEGAMQLFQKFKIVEMLDDGTIVLPGVQQLIGSETEWAKKKRAQRTKGDNVPQMSSKCPIEKEKEKEKETDKEKELEDREKNNNAVCQQIADLFNSLCPSYPPVKHLSDPILTAITDSLAKYSLDEFTTLFDKAEASTFLKGGNERNWTASFDWLVDAANMAKVLNGNFDNKRKKSKKSSAASFDLEAYERMIDKAANPPKTMAEDESIRSRAEALQKKLNGSDT